MPIKYCSHMISRKELRDNKNHLYVFGDNMLRQGYGGQAKEMRGEPNAIGIPTKYFPAMVPTAFFNNQSLSEPSVEHALRLAFHTIEICLEENRIVVIPAAGIGTGLAELPKRAPGIHKYITDKLKELGDKYGSYEV
jgi:hypothetical protein